MSKRAPVDPHRFNFLPQSLLTNKSRTNPQLKKRTFLTQGAFEWAGAAPLPPPLPLVQDSPDSVPQLEEEYVKQFFHHLDRLLPTRAPVAVPRPPHVSIASRSRKQNMNPQSLQTTLEGLPNKSLMPVLPASGPKPPPKVTRKGRRVAPHLLAPTIHKQMLEEAAQLQQHQETTEHLRRVASGTQAKGSKLKRITASMMQAKQLGRTFAPEPEEEADEWDTEMDKWVKEYSSWVKSTSEGKRPLEAQIYHRKLPWNISPTHLHPMSQIREAVDIPKELRDNYSMHNVTLIQPDKPILVATPPQEHSGRHHKGARQQDEKDSSKAFAGAWYMPVSEWKPQAAETQMQDNAQPVDPQKKMQGSIGGVENTITRTSSQEDMITRNKSIVQLGLTSTTASSRHTSFSSTVAPHADAEPGVHPQDDLTWLPAANHIQGSLRISQNSSRGPSAPTSNFSDCASDDEEDLPWTTQLKKYLPRDLNMNPTTRDVQQKDRMLEQWQAANAMRPNGGIAAPISSSAVVQE
eukprot:TRINITY_DN67783_c6_g3_i1.p1 TRINITY_DN67783_c6_g3~~TRINITY_DN67783_c6_g3_i1.p1  ORF type:complete len:520 (+),score=39.72 TRINITY_DN67783_c6_g3_i1:36-1595(+)